MIVKILLKQAIRVYEILNLNVVFCAKYVNAKTTFDQDDDQGIVQK